MNKSFLTLYLLGLALLSVVACSQSGIAATGVTSGGPTVGYTDPSPVQTSSNPPTLNPNAYTVATSPTASGSSSPSSLSSSVSSSASTSGGTSCNMSSYGICVKNAPADSCASSGGTLVTSCPSGYAGSCKSGAYTLYYYSAIDSTICSNN